MAAFFLIGILLAAEDPSVFAQAHQASNEAQAEYELGHFQLALELYEKAYKLRPIPGLLFNVAQCHRKLGQLKEAADTYRMYLLKSEDGSAEEAHGRELLRQVEEAIQQEEAARKAPPHEPIAQPSSPEAPSLVLVQAPPAATAPALPPEPLPQSRRHTISWVLSGAGAAALAAGAVFGARSHGAANDLASTTHTGSEAQSLISTGKQSAITADVLFLAAAAFGLTAVILW